MTKLPLTAVVVTYHPTREMIQRIRRHADFLAHVVVVDNTEQAAGDDLALLQDVTYLPMGSNRGLGDALNAGVEQAASLGWTSVLLLDQDSELTREAAAVALAAQADGIGIVSLHQVVRGRAEPGKQRSGCIDVPVTMTSGSLLDIRAYRSCGPFDTQLFIDYVDHDYCLRLRRSGYRIVQCLDASLDHELGEQATHRMLGATVRFVTHRPFRSYYIVRNGLYVAFRYFADDPWVALGVLKVLCKEIVKAVAFEGDKLLRLRYMGLGLRHWLANRYGKVALP